MAGLEMEMLAWLLVVAGSHGRNPDLCEFQFGVACFLTFKPNFS